MNAKSIMRAKLGINPLVGCSVIEIDTGERLGTVKAVQDGIIVIQLPEGGSVARSAEDLLEFKFMDRWDEFRATYSEALEVERKMGGQLGASRRDVLHGDACATS